ncbi:AdipoR/hemolysin-III-related [Dillenia turbinata]|uniref:AdipoR/hemolysin-III-related n=1 Tax=Dillenia turbinata TaxID=194707 RepID=A0AAN8W300_9MAGN
MKRPKQLILVGASLHDHHLFFFPPIYYIFQCDRIWQIIYLTGITAIGIFTIVTLLSPVLSSGKFRTFRALLFLAMGLFGLIPAIHAIVANWHEPRCPITLAYESAMALGYIMGTMFYVSRIPEKFKPGGST